MKVAYVHDWLVTYRGGERVLEALLELYPDAPIYTLFYDASQMPETINKKRIIYPKWLQPFKRFRKPLLPILPFIIESLPIESYDLVISTSSCVAKGIVPGPQSKHISYIHSPMRYVWDQRHHYLKGKPKIVKMMFNLISTALRNWDTTSTVRVDSIIANSSFISSRIERYYGRKSTVVHPPVNTGLFTPESPSQKQGYFLAAGAFVPYKGLDTAIKACETLGKKLIVAGSGPEEETIRRLAGPNTQVLSQPSQKEWVKLFQEADAFLFPALEDFGITALEAMAAGTPVIAYRGGGALDFIQEGKTGQFFDEQKPESLAKTLESFDPTDYDQKQLHEFAEGFTKEHFLSKFKYELDSLIQEQSR